jgi:hypothetical protein
MTAENKNYLNDISQSVGIILLALASFLGMLYMRRGDIILTGIIILIGVLALFGTVYLLWRAKEAKRNRGFDLREALLLVVTVAIAFSAYIPIFHFSNLEFNSKTQIRNLGTEIAKEIRTLPLKFDEQAEEAMTRMEVQMENAGKTQTGINARKKTIKNILAQTKKNLLIDSFDINNNARFINSWNRLRLNQAFYNLDAIFNDHLDQLQKGMDKPTIEEWSGEFVYERQYDAGEIISDPWLMVDNSEYEVDFLIPFAVCLFCVLLILVPYFRQKRGLIWRDDLHDVD